MPFGRGSRIFYAALLPGLLGIVFMAGSRKLSQRGMRLLGLIVVLGFSTIWMASCSGSNSGNHDPGTLPGTYPITVSATTGGAAPVTNSNSPFIVNLVVTQ
jgi:vacuolar-type H+-ATPase subunit I/STV1